MLLMNIVRMQVSFAKGFDSTVHSAFPHKLSTLEIAL